jgi:thiol-disulfide isomerase/thioredoxin
MSRVQKPELDRNEYQSLISQNTDSILVFKFGAGWCGPCKRSKDMIYGHVNRMPDNVKFYDIDVDESFDLYAWLKSRKQVNGIPVLLAYYPGNITFASNNAITGAEPGSIQTFFDEVHRAALTIK